MSKNFDKKRDRKTNKELVSKEVVRTMIKSSSLNTTAVGWYDSFDTYAAQVSPNFQDMTNVGQNTGSNNRTGQSIRVTKLVVFWDCILGDTFNIIRIIIFKWFPSNSSDVPQISEVFNTQVSLSTAINYPVRSPFLALKPSRFKVLADYRIVLDAAHVTRCGTIVLKNLGLLSFDYQSSNGKNHIYHAVMADSGVLPHPTVNLSYTSYFENT